MNDSVVPEGQAPCVVHHYALGGPQVQPDASYWMFCSKLHIVTIDELLAATDKPDKPTYFPPYPDPCSKEGKAETEREFAELVALTKRRDDPCSLVNADVAGSDAAYPNENLHSERIITARTG